MSKAEEIKKLKELLDDGAITRDEFDKEKDNILNAEEMGEKKFQEELKEDEGKSEIANWKAYLLLIIVASSCYGYCSTDSEAPPSDEMFLYCVDEKIIDNIIYCPNGDVYEFDLFGD